MPLILRKYNAHEWENLAKWKRVWTAIILNHALDERISSIESVATRFQIEISDLEGLLYSGKIVASKLQQFCQEIGHNQIAVLIKEYKSNFDKNIPSELKPLLIIPSMNLKIARVLYDTLNIANLNDLLNTSTEKIVYQCYLSSGFVLNEEDADGKSNNSVVTKDHLYRQQIIDWVVKIVNFAKNVVSDSMNLVQTSNTTQVAPIVETILEAVTFETNTSDVESYSSDDENGVDDDDDDDEIASVIQEVENFEDENDEDSNMPFYSLARSDNVLDNTVTGILTPKPKNIFTMFQSPVPTISLVLETVKGSDESKKSCNTATKTSTPTCPLLTPLVQSLNKSGSKFLYLSQINHDETLNSIDYDVIPLGQEECNKINAPTFAEDVCNVEKSGFIWKHVSNGTSCLSFLKELGTCKVVSFELVFSKLPVNTRKNGNLNRWLESIAFSCPRSSSSTFGGVSTLDCLGISGEKNERCMFNDPNVICGIALSFGSDTSYYMPLPILPPQLSYDGINNTDTYHLVGSLDNLPFKVKERIARYVGFDLILCKCPYLKSRTSKYIMDKNLVASIISNPTSCHLDHCSNPLMSLNKSWAMASRSALRKEWRKGSCIEWQILNEIMNNKGVTKIAFGIKNQLLCLRERDIIVNGPLEDPNIAALLLPPLFQTQSINAEKEILNMQKLRIPKPTNTISTNNESRGKSLFESYRQSCFRAIAVFRLMVKYSNVLRSFGLLDLYRNIEMPLHLSVIDAEYSGAPIQPNFFATIRQDLTDRQNIISLYLNRVNNEKNVDLSDYTVVNGLKVAIKNKLVSCFERQIESSGIFTHQKALKMAEEKLVDHPLIRLIDEYRINDANIVICNSILKHKYILRTRAAYNTIGSSTGRLSLSNPNTQAIPHESLYTCTRRSNIYDEYLTIAMEKRTFLLHNINSEIASGKIIWVKIIENDNNLTSCRDFISGTTIGRLLRLLDNSENNETNLLVNNIEIHATIECNYSGKVTTVPCTKVYRLDSSLLANDDEVKDINNCIDNGIFPLTEQSIRPATISLRWGFQAEVGYTFVSFDYKQIELRIMAHFSGDMNLINLFKSDKDVFMLMASKWKSKNINDITVKERNEIKHICYGLFYGAGKQLLASHLECSIEEATLKYNNFLKRFPLLKIFMENTKEFCRTHGYVETLMGRRCYFKDINDDDLTSKSKAERQCINSIIQGSAADLIKLAMINVHSELIELSRKTNLIKFRAKRIYPGGGLYKRLDDVRLCMSIHDELIYEIPKEPEIICNIVGLIKETMENNVLNLKVPLRVKVRCGDTWGDLQEFNNV